MKTHKTIKIRNYKTVLLLGLSFFLFQFSTKAQVNPAIYFSGTTSLTSHYNPALTCKADFFLGVPFLTSFNLDIRNRFTNVVSLRSELRLATRTTPNTDCNPRNFITGTKRTFMLSFLKPLNFSTFMLNSPTISGTKTLHRSKS